MPLNRFTISSLENFTLCCLMGSLFTYVILGSGFISDDELISLFIILSLLYSISSFGLSFLLTGEFKLNEELSNDSITSVLHELLTIGVMQLFRKS